MGISQNGKSVNKLLKIFWHGYIFLGCWLRLTYLLAKSNKNWIKVHCLFKIFFAIFSIILKLKIKEIIKNIFIVISITQ